MKNKLVEQDFNLIAHFGSGFDTYIVSNKSPEWKTVFNLLKNGAGFFPLKIFNGYVGEVKKALNAFILGVERCILRILLENIGRSYNLQHCLLQTEFEHDEIYENTWEAKENEWLPYLRHNVLSTGFSYARYSKGNEELTGSRIKNSKNNTSFFRLKF